MTTKVDPVNGYLSSFSPLQAQGILNSILPTLEEGASAAGTDQATAYEIKTQAIKFDTVGAGEGAKLPFLRGLMFVSNSGAGPLLLYPQEGCTINGNAVNAPQTVPDNYGIVGYWGNTEFGQDPKNFYILFTFTF